jgi:hypothetical protein
MPDDAVDAEVEERLALCRPFVVVCGVPVLVAAAVAIACGAAGACGNGRTSTVALTTAMVLAAVSAGSPLLRRHGGRFGLVIAALGAAATGPVLGYHVARALDHAVRFADAPGVGHLDPHVVMPWAAFATFVGGGLAWALTAAVRPKRLTAALQAVAGTLLACAAGALTFGAARAATRPTASAYVASLPLVATLPPMRTREGGRWIVKWGYRFLQPIADDDEREVDGIFTRRRCTTDGCTLQILTRGRDRSAGPLPGRDWTVDVHDTVWIRRDERHHQLVVERGAGAPHARLWLDAATGAGAEPAVSVTATAPPVDWLLGGALGLVVAVAALAFRPAAVRQAARARHGRVGIADGETVTFPDGTPPLALPPSRAGVRGPVVVVPARLPPQPSFRETGAIVEGEILLGTQADLADAAEVASAGRAAYAIFALAIACAPLAVG